MTPQSKHDEFQWRATRCHRRGNSISGHAHMLPRERGALNIWLCAPGKRYAVECKASLSGYS
ncbi:hypothetical protein F153LOC_17195 [Lelliottia sp. F153]|nr:hypothetical protein F159LOC_03475 [Lelliottia sp. F159]PLY51156.1 hypothetical protein F154LOC_06080 [Lelliottia sp. F154]PLY53582.1 hypothetical protein F153LOC_17195 [Lelliottia sp. F153]